MRAKRPLLSLILSLLLLTSSGLAQRVGAHLQKPPLVSLCEVIAHPIDFSGKIVRFRANAVTDGYEYASLIDPRCQGGVSPWSAGDTDEHPDVKAFNEAFEAQKSGFPHQRIQAVFTGHFVYDSMENNASRRKKFEIVEVADLKVSTDRPD